MDSGSAFERPGHDQTSVRQRLGRRGQQSVGRPIQLILSVRQSPIQLLNNSGLSTSRLPFKHNHRGTTLCPTMLPVAHQAAKDRFAVLTDKNPLPLRPLVGVHYSDAVRFLCQRIVPAHDPLGISLRWAASQVSARLFGRKPSSDCCDVNDDQKGDGYVVGALAGHSAFVSAGVSISPRQTRGLDDDQKPEPLPTLRSLLRRAQQNSTL